MIPFSISRMYCSISFCLISIILLCGIECFAQKEPIQIPKNPKTWFVDFGIKNTQKVRFSNTGKGALKPRQTVHPYLGFGFRQDRITGFFHQLDAGIETNRVQFIGDFIYEDGNGTTQTKNLSNIGSSLIPTAYLSISIGNPILHIKNKTILFIEGGFRINSFLYEADLTHSFGIADETENSQTIDLFSLNYTTSIKPITSLFARLSTRNDKVRGFHFHLLGNLALQALVKGDYSVRNMETNSFTGEFTLHNTYLALGTTYSW